MSEAIAFDTHRFVKHLTENGFTEQQAEVLADEQVHLLNTNLATQADVAAIQREIVGVKRDIEVLRQETKTSIAGVQRDIEVLRQETKTSIAGVQRDIEVLRQETKTSIAGVQRDIEALRQETKADIEALRLGTKADMEALRLGTKADMAEVKSDLLKWMMGALIAQGGVVVALLKLLQG